MKATTVFLARLTNAAGKFPLAKVELKRDKPIEPKGASSYYARYSGIRKDGTRGRIVQPLASSNVDEAYVEFLNIDTAQRQIRAAQKPTFTGIATVVPSGQTLLNIFYRSVMKRCPG